VKEKDKPWSWVGAGMVKLIAFHCLSPRWW
jgi:hypothetical protein